MTVYADNAATTRMSRTALDAMLPAMEENYGNPSSLHSVGQRAAELLMKSRETVARCLNCQPREIIFTSGGSEADNQALLSAAAIGRRKGKMHIISTAFEHHAILHTLKKLEKEGFEVELLPVHENGTTPAQMKMFLTRIGFGSKVIVTGDASQKDLPGGTKSGLEVALKVLSKVDDIGFCELTSKDVVRHPLVQKIVQAYESYEKAQERRSSRKDSHDYQRRR